MFPGIGTVVNVATVLVGATVGVLLGQRLRQGTRDVLTRAVGDSAPTLIVLASLVVGGIIGSLLRIEERLEDAGGWLQDRLTGRGSGRGAGSDRARFIEGFVSSSLVVCVGPLTVLGSINDGLGNGAEQLYLKSALDGFAAIAFAASLGWGVAASAIAVLVVQGALTGSGAALGTVGPNAEVAALGATGGLMLVGVALRLLRIKQVRVGDLLPGLVVAPLLTALVATLR